jgi:hypothetical protein
MDTSSRGSPCVQAQFTILQGKAKIENDFSLFLLAATWIWLGLGEPKSTV